MIKERFKCLLFGLIFSTVLFCSTRVAFSRPSSVIRTPGMLEQKTSNQYVVGFGGEILTFSNLNYSPAVYFHGLNISGFNVGVSYSTHAAQTLGSTPIESNFSIHVDREVFNKDNMRINVGVHDIIYEAPTTHRLSMFVTFSQFFNLNTQYDLLYNIGFGTGYLAKDSHAYDDDLNNNNDAPKHPATLFLSTIIKTPVLGALGGLKVLGEIAHMDGWGGNIGVQVPLSESWKMNIGMTNLQNIQLLNDWTANNKVIGGASAIALGFQMTIPTPNYDAIKNPIEKWDNPSYMHHDMHSDSLINRANMIIHTLEDSLNLKDLEYQTLEKLNKSLKYKINILSDSINGMTLTNKIFQNKLNEAMKHLSTSLKFYYSENYLEALNQVDKALEIYPDLAISYARKGSIYYKMEDLNKATINWNIALQLDPEFGAVRDILLSVKNNKESMRLPE